MRLTHLKEMMTGCGLALTVAFSVPGWADHQEGHGSGESGGMGMMKQLNLTPEQKEKFKAIRKSGRETGKSLVEKKKALRQKFQTALKSGASDGELRSIHQEIMAARTAAGNHRFEQLLKKRGILTDEQKKKFGELRGGRKGRKRRRSR